MFQGNIMISRSALYLKLCWGFLAKWSVRLIYLILSSLFICSAFAQEHEAASFRYEQQADGHDQGLNLRSVVYVHKFQDWMWLHSLGYRERSLQNVFGQDARSQTLIYPGFLRKQMSENWNTSLFYSISSSRLDQKFNFQSESTFANLFFLFSQDQSHDQNSAWSFGMAIFDRSSPVSLFPVFGYVYQDISRRHRFRFGYPAVSYSYNYSDDTKFNIFLRFDRENSFSERQITANSDILKHEYLSYERVIYGIQLNQRLRGDFFLQYTIGQSDFGQTKILDQDFKEISNEKRNGGFYISLGLSFIVDLSKMKEKQSDLKDLK